ncbi:MAG: sulfatase [Planctomycetota bacterium]
MKLNAIHGFMLCVALGWVDPIAVLSQDRALPNVLFIAVDDLRTSLGCYGDVHAISPNIDRLANQGVRFSRAYCQVAVCNPSRASLMTGLRPDTLGVWTLPIHFREARPDAVTLPQWFRQYGYTAISHGKIYHNPTPDPQSWSEPIRKLPTLPYPYPDGTRERVRSVMRSLPPRDWRKNNLRGPSTGAPDLSDQEVLDGARTEMAVEDLRRLSKESKPFFLAMGFIRPHLAWVAPKKYWDLHDPATLPVLEGQRVIPDTPPYAPHNNSELSHYVDLVEMPRPWDGDTLSVQKARHLMHAYYACVSFVDAQIGRLLSALDEVGASDNTIVVLWSDHGWKLGENRGWGKMTNYEIDARVPLIIKAPEAQSAALRNAGKESASLVELLDLYPTLCELAGIEVPDFVDGRSLVPALEDVNAKIHDQAMSQYYRKHEGREYMGYSMRTPSHRYVEWREFGSGTVTAQELYDHQNQLSESVNMIDSAPQELVDRLSSQLATAHPRRSLVMTPAIHSSPSPGRWKADITFENRCDVDAVVHAITPTGRRGRASRIRPGASLTINARIGGVYVVENEDGSLHEIHSPSFPARTVVLECPPSAE